jgi:hypothetical protein
MRCFGCGVYKDPEKKERYPHKEDGLVTNEPIAPLMVIDCQGPRIPNHPEGYSEFRVIVVCHECLHRLKPDMWVSEACWAELKPMVGYRQLPLLDSAPRAVRSSPVTYAHVRVLG